MNRIFLLRLFSGIIFCLHLAYLTQAQGTYPVFPNITDHSVAAASTLLGASGNRLVYFDVVSNSNKLWISDGTPEGTKLVSPANQTEIQVFYHDTSTWYFTERRGSAFYISALNNDSDTLVPMHTSGIRYQDILYWKGKFSWIQNSAGSGYSRLQSYDPVADTLVTLLNLQYLALRALGASDSLIFFIASTDTGKMLGSSEGTPASTKFITTLFPAGSSFDQQSRFFSNGKKVYFFYHPEPDPFILWTTDGTSDGTIQLGSFQDPDFGWPEDPALFLEDKLFFILRELGAPSGTTYELNATDGTPAGTLTLDDNPNTYTQPRDLTLFQSKVYFVSFSWGADLRESDGTLQGTKIVLDAFGHQSGGIGGIAALGTFNNSLIIQGFENVHGAELYESDGTKSGTFLLSDVIRGAASSSPEKFIQVGNRLFFTAEYAGRERLWIYDPDFSFTCDSLLVDSLMIVPVTDSTLGSMAITMIGGQQPYVYSLNDGANTYNPTFSNLAAGVYDLNVTDNLGCLYETSFMISETTSILEPELVKSISVRPNPSTSAHGITVKLDLVAGFMQEALSVSVYSMEGRLYHRHPLQVIPSGIEYKIDTNGWPQGQYVLIIQAGKTIIANEVMIIQ